jgi:hypothetical protein
MLVSYVATVTLMQSMKKFDNKALHCICNFSIENAENLWEATVHLMQFSPEKFPVHLSASQANGVGGGPPPGQVPPPLSGHVPPAFLCCTYWECWKLQMAFPKLQKPLDGKSLLKYYIST